MNFSVGDRVVLLENGYHRSSSADDWMHPGRKGQVVGIKLVNGVPLVDVWVYDHPDNFMPIDDPVWPFYINEIAQSD